MARRSLRNVIVIEDNEDDERTDDSSGCEMIADSDSSAEDESGDSEQRVDERWILENSGIYCQNDGNILPQIMLTDYSIYNKRGKLVSLEDLEQQKTLFFKGSVMPISDDAEPVLFHCLQPLTEWWLGAYGEDEKARFGVTTDLADYTLVEPSVAYAPFMQPISKKILLSKDFITFLERNPNGHIDDAWFTDEIMQEHSEWLAEQVISYDEGRDEDDLQLALCPAFRTFLRVTGITPKSKKLGKKTKPRQSLVIVKKEKMVATTTAAVRQLFSKDFKSLFGAATMSGDFEVIISDDEGEEDGDAPPRSAQLSRNPRGHKNRMLAGEVEWGPLLREDHCSSHYESATVDNVKISPGDYVQIEHDDSAKEPHLGRVILLFERQDSPEPQVHIHWLHYTSTTLLRETGKDNELYFSYDECQDVDLSSVMCRVNVTEVSQLTVNDSHVHYGMSDERLYCVEYVYNDTTGAFTSPAKPKKFTCPSCAVLKARRLKESPSISDGILQYWQNEYSIGCYMFVQTENKENSATLQDKEKVVANSKFPEQWRRQNDSGEPPRVAPLTIGRLLGIHWADDDDAHEVVLTLQRFFRPEETSLEKPWLKDIRLVFPSDQIFEAHLDTTWGRCNVINAREYVGSLDEFLKESDNNFYYEKSYLHAEGLFIDFELDAKLLLRRKPVKREMRSKRSTRKRAKLMRFEDNPISIDDDDLIVVMSSDEEELASCQERSISWSSSDSSSDSSSYSVPSPIVSLPNVEAKLRSLDLFSGCGGLSLGLSQAGVSEACWAVERDPVIAEAFKRNFPKCCVYAADCNAMLGSILAGESCDPSGQVYPLKGEVDLISAGPPCQGYSLLNKFTSSEAYQFKNSLVVTALSFCDYYQPKYFVMENVSTFATHKGGNLLKLVIRCLLELGYQCRFGILQAGSYGVPQSRRRFILMAAAQGLLLPAFPEPIHAFPVAFGDVYIDKRKFKPGLERIKIGHLRPLQIRDAFDDLPDVAANSTTAVHIKPTAKSLPWSSDSSVVFDHCVRPVDALNAARFAHIPRVRGADWRDLPNISVPLSDGSQTNILKYPFKGQIEGCVRKGVCACVEGKKCKSERQKNTLIPWWLPHTAQSNNHWKGVYGRLDERGCFRTIITNPQPGVKQGRVLHPSKDRIASVRECARGQGFPDDYIFVGTIEKRYIQVGNAVPPPLAKAIGIEIRKSLISSQHR